MENIEKCGNCVYYQPFNKAENESTGNVSKGVCKYDYKIVCVGSESGCARWQTNTHKYNNN